MEKSPFHISESVYKVTDFRHASKESMIIENCWDQQILKGGNLLSAAVYGWICFC